MERGRTKAHGAHTLLGTSGAGPKERSHKAPSQDHWSVKAVVSDIAAFHHRGFMTSDSKAVIGSSSDHQTHRRYICTGWSRACCTMNALSTTMTVIHRTVEKPLLKLGLTLGEGES